ncbi:MAG: GldG family protein [Microgenomates group bacterium]
MIKKIFVPLLFGVFFVSNWLVSFLPLKLDLSAGGVYTLSSSTKKILKSLEKSAQIKFFVSSDLPSRLLPLKRDVLDFLEEYKRVARGKIDLKILDPSKDSKAKEEAQKEGLPQLQFSQLEKNKYALSNAYFGIVFSYKDKKEIIPQVTDIESLEYNITSTIYKLSKKDLPKIGVIGQEQVFFQQDDPLFTFKKIAGQQFDLQFITDEFDKNYATLLIFDNNKKNYSQEEIDKIQKYLNEGGKAIFFVDGVWVGENLLTTPANHNLFSLLEKNGIKLNKNLVLSTSAELVNFGNQLVQFLTPYPFWLKTNIFNNNQSYFSNINQLTYPWVSSLDLVGGIKLKKTPLVYSTKKSWEQKEATGSAGFILDPQSIPQPSQKDLKQFILAAKVKISQKGEMVVIPSSRFILERYLTRGSDNLDFVLNILNDLASGGALSGIRQRAIGFYPLPDLPEGQKDIFKYLNIFLFPSFFGFFGLVKLLKRR